MRNVRKLLLPAAKWRDAYRTTAWPQLRKRVFNAPGDPRSGRSSSLGDRDTQAARMTNRRLRRTNAVVVPGRKGGPRDGEILAIVPNSCTETWRAWNPGQRRDRSQSSPGDPALQVDLPSMAWGSPGTVAEDRQPRSESLRLARGAKVATTSRTSADPRLDNPPPVARIERSRRHPNDGEEPETDRPRSARSRHGTLHAKSKKVVDLVNWSRDDASLIRVTRDRRCQGWVEGPEASYSDRRIRCHTVP